jgi:hypothetical protein
MDRKIMQEKFDSKCRESTFLEEECRMLREIVGDLKTDTSGGVVSSPMFPSSLIPDQNLDYDDETESVLGQYSMLREEINNTGAVLLPDHSDHTHDSDTIFDRLTNPSNFTGTQKNIFKQDIVTNRAKVQQMKGDTHRKERKRKEDGEGGITAGGGVHGGGNDVEEEVTTPPSSPPRPASSSKRVTTPSSGCPNSVSRSPSNLNENVFSRLLNPNKFTGIHRRAPDSSPAEVSHVKL